MPKEYSIIYFWCEIVSFLLLVLAAYVYRGNNKAAIVLYIAAMFGPLYFEFKDMEMSIYAGIALFCVKNFIAGFFIEGLSAYFERKKKPIEN